MTGYVDAANCVCLREHLQRFVKLGSPLILDAIEARLVGYHGADLFDDFASHCARARVECALVGGRHAGPKLQARGVTAVPLFVSADQAAQYFNNALGRHEQRANGVMARTTRHRAWPEESGA